mmetsp:Transcript_137377/g.383193  ORF Transcript_137377/g.383193 Transcript_137377/m.383193 type:complete len:168 (+) Transcript_137377:138-641(+)
MARAGGADKRMKSASKTIKYTGTIMLDEEPEPCESDVGRLLVFDTDKTELCRVELPTKFRQGSKSPEAWKPQLFKDYLTEALGFTVTEVYYKVRDHKKGATHLRYAQLGVSDRRSEWPFVAGMKIFVGTPSDSAKPGFLQRNASMTFSQASTTDSTVSSGGSSCSVM